VTLKALAFLFKFTLHRQLSLSFLSGLIYLVLFFALSFQVQVAANTFYVNDGSTAGDIYTTAAGSDTAGCGASPSSPCQTINYLMTQQALGGANSHTVLVDTGSYGDNTVITPGTMANISGGNRLIIQGAGPGNTVFNAASGYGIKVDNTGTN